MCDSCLGSRHQLDMEGCDSMPQQGLLMQPFVVPMMFYCTPTGIGNFPQDLPAYSAPHVKPEPDDTPEETIEKPHCDGDDEVYYHLALAYNGPG